MPAERVHRRWQGWRVRPIIQHVGGLFLDIPDRINPRQQGRAIAKGLQEGRAERLRRTTRRHENGRAGQRLGTIGKIANAGGKRIRERNPGRNGIDAVVTGRQRRHAASIEATPREDEAARYNFM